MTTFVWSNFFSTTLSASVASGDTTINVASATNAPTIAAGQQWAVIVQSASTPSSREVMYVTAIASDAFTVTRGQEGTAAGTWAIGDYVIGGNTEGVMAALGQLGAPNTWTEPQTIDGNGSGDALTISDTGNAAGAVVKLTGNGATTPSKFMRVLSGVLQFVNSAYTTAIGSLDDSGNFTAAGTGTFNGGSVNVTSTAGNAGVTLQGATGSKNWGWYANTNGALTLYDITDAKTPIIVDTFYNLTALNKLRATTGATGSGDGLACTILNDFGDSIGTNGYQKLPSGIIIQWGTGSVISGGTGSITYPIAFPNACLHIWTDEIHPAGTWPSAQPTLYAAENTTLTASSATVYGLIWSGSAWSGSSVGGFRYVAIGY